MEKLQFEQNLYELVKLAQNVVGRMLEKNAMNHAPSEAELNEMMKKITDIGERLGNMEHTAGQNAEKYKVEAEQYAGEAERLIIHYTELCTKLENILKALDEKQAEMEKLEAGLENAQYVKMCAMEEKVNLERRKSKGEDYRVVHQNIMDRETQVENLIRQMESQKGTLIQTQAEEKKIRSQSEENKRQQQDTLEKNGKAKEEMTYWEGMMMKMQNLRSRFSAGTMSPDTLLEVMELLEQMEAK